MEDIKQKILDAMKVKSEPMRAGEIAELAGLDRKDVDKAMKVLKKEELIESPKRCFWQPK
jgi:DNA-binding transcriptional regulator GbsR (MarR family)